MLRQDRCELKRTLLRDHSQGVLIDALRRWSRDEAAVVCKNAARARSRVHALVALGDRVSYSGLRPYLTSQMTQQ